MATSDQPPASSVVGSADPRLDEYQKLIVCIGVVADGRLAVMLVEISPSVVSAPEVRHHPSRAVAERPDVPPPLPGHRGKLGHRLIAANGRKAIRIDPRPPAFPGHDLPDFLR